MTATDDLGSSPFKALKMAPEETLERVGGRIIYDAYFTVRDRPPYETSISYHSYKRKDAHAVLGNLWDRATDMLNKVMAGDLSGLKDVGNMDS